ncbi:Gfo/Idh/MocA family protein [Nonomuraea terrae]|uniref:Gfo/Idh/MocA family protein n=1 Tax=Nonomuraea terrae TaxID=2530383 RepID=UPI0037B90E0C
MAASKLGVGIAGLGLISKTHAAAYQRMSDVVDLVAGCDVDPKAAAAFADEHGAKTYSDLNDLINDPAVDVVDLILPHHLHYDAAMAVLDAGKHLILEKPVAPTYEQSVAIHRRAVEAGVHFMVAENTRYIAAYQAVERLLKEGAIGEVIHARTYLRSNEKAHLSLPGYWRTRYELGGGLVMDTGAHSFYLLKWLLGEVDELTGISKKVFPLDNEIEDTAEVYGRLKSGAHFSCGFTSVSEVPHSERLELFGTEGGILVDQMADPVVKLFRGQHDFQGEAVEGVPFGPDAWHPGGWHYESVLTEVTDYVRSLVEGRPPLIDSGDTVYAMRVVEAAYESIKSGRPVTGL